MMVTHIPRDVRTGMILNTLFTRSKALLIIICVTYDTGGWRRANKL